MLGDGLVRRLKEDGLPVASKPGEARPVLVPPIDEQRDLGAPADVPDAGEIAWIRHLLRLLVERRVDDRPVGFAGQGKEDVADRDQARPAVVPNRGERRTPGRTQKCTLLGGQA
jgi:hypothetical protein